MTVLPFQVVVSYEFGWDGMVEEAVARGRTAMSLPARAPACAPTRAPAREACGAVQRHREVDDRTSRPDRKTSSGGPPSPASAGSTCWDIATGRPLRA